MTLPHQLHLHPSFSSVGIPCSRLSLFKIRIFWVVHMLKIVDKRNKCVYMIIKFKTCIAVQRTTSWPQTKSSHPRCEFNGRELGSPCALSTIPHSSAPSVLDQELDTMAAFRVDQSLIINSQVVSKISSCPLNPWDFNTRIFTCYNNHITFTTFIGIKTTMRRRETYLLM